MKTPTSSVRDRYPVGTVLHGLKIVNYEGRVKRLDGRLRSGTYGWVVRVECQDCGREWNGVLAEIIRDRVVCYCVTSDYINEGKTQNG